MAHICNYSVKNWSEWVWLNPLQLYWTNSFVCITAGYDTGCGDHGYSLHYLVNVSEWIRSRKRRQEDVWLMISTQWRRMAQCLKMLWMMVTVNSNLSSAFSCALKLLITGLNNAQKYLIQVMQQATRTGRNKHANRVATVQLFFFSSFLPLLFFWTLWLWFWGHDYESQPLCKIVKKSGSTHNHNNQC